MQERALPPHSLLEGGRSGAPHVHLAVERDDDEKRLHGRHVVFKWEEWGFACGKIGPTRHPKANFSISYEGGWKDGMYDGQPNCSTTS